MYVLVLAAALALTFSARPALAQQALDSAPGPAFARAVAVQADGRIVVAGFSSEPGSEPDFALARLQPDGSLDATFGTDGQVTTGFGGGTGDYAAAAAIQPDGRIVVAGWTSDGSDADFALARYTAAGKLDATFGAGGKVTTGFGGGSADYAAAVAIQPDGRIVVAGWTSDGGGADFALARYTAAGDLDASFSGDGRVTTAFSSSSDLATAVAIQPDGRIVVAGWTSDGSDADFALARYTAAGNLDATFGAGGKVTTGFGGGSADYAAAVAIQPDGRIVVAGSAADGDADFALARYTAAGNLDATFGAGGKVTTGLGSGTADEATTIAIQDNGRIVVAGWTSDRGDADFALARYTAAGDLDASFSGDGWATEEVSTGTGDYARAVAVQTDGRIVTAVETQDRGDFDFALARYTAGGTLDPAFGTDGRVVLGETDADEPSTITIALTPQVAPVVIPEEGGAFSFTVLLTNTGAQAETFSAWSALTEPDGSTVSPVVGPVVVTLRPGRSVTRTLRQTVAPSAPPGVHTYRGYAGTFPSGAVASDEFTFTKEGAAAPAPPEGDPGVWAAFYADSGVPVLEGDLWADEDDAPEDSLVVASKAEGLPDVFDLLPAYPNPGSEAVTLPLALPEGAVVRVEAYDLLGRRVATLAEGAMEAGTHRLRLDGAALAAGVYVVRAVVTPEQGAPRHFVRRVTLLR